MKVTNIIIACSIIICSAVLAVSCVKDTGKEAAIETTDFSNKSFVQVYDATIGSTRNYVYVDAMPVTGAALAFGSAFPSTSSPATFAIPSGLRSFSIRDTLSTSTQPRIAFAENFKANTSYTIFTYDTVNAAKQKTFENSIVIPADTTSRIRFANFVYAPFALTPLDVFSKKRNAVVFTNVGTSEVSDYIPYDSRNSDTLVLRATGTTTNILNNAGTVATPNYQPIQIIITPVRKRSYTVVYKGSYRNDLNSSTTARSLSLVASN